MTSTFVLPWQPPTTPEGDRLHREWLELVRAAGNESLKAWLANVAPHLSWQPVDENTPRDRWILMKGGHTDEDFYEEEMDELSRYAVSRPVTAHWRESQDSWVTACWDGRWRNVYNDPTHWMEIPA